MDIIILMSWSIWMSRNDWIFKGIAPSIIDVTHWFKREFTLVILIAKPRFSSYDAIMARLFVAIVLSFLFPFMFHETIA
jgi:hypothetical protein